MRTASLGARQGGYLAKDDHVSDGIRTEIQTALEQAGKNSRDRCGGSRAVLRLSSRLKPPSLRLSALCEQAAALSSNASSHLSHLFCWPVRSFRISLNGKVVRPRFSLLKMTTIAHVVERVLEDTALSRFMGYRR